MNTLRKPPKRYRRWGLYVPFVVLGALAAVWCVFWFVARDKGIEAVDRLLAREAQAGRNWTCEQRRIGGFPFRFELECERPHLSSASARGNLEIDARHLTAVWQIYDPAFVIASLEGPLTVRDAAAPDQVRAEWRTLRASLRGLVTLHPQLSVEGSALAVKLSNGGSETLLLNAEAADAHVRQNQSRPDSEHAFDVLARLERAVIPELDRFMGSEAASTLELQATITEADALLRGSRAERLDRWRASRGVLDLVLLSLTRQAQRLQAKGQLSLDSAGRPQGSVQASASGVDELLRRVSGKQQVLADVVVGSLNVLAKRERSEAKAQLVPLPPLRIVDGRVFLGPIRLPFIVPPLT